MIESPPSTLSDHPAGDHPAGDRPAGDRPAGDRPAGDRPAGEEQGQVVEFRVDPAHYKHWRLEFEGPVATLTMDVDEHGGIVPGYDLKLNSYDLGVDIELYDALQRLRFEHPELRCVVLTSGKEKIFCAGANIRMLASSSHHWKVNFCKFTNETRNAIEDASANSGQVWIAALNGTASGGGYELALACDHIMLVDDRSSAVSLPEAPLLAVLPGTGGLTRVVDKRHVRRDLADYFSTRPEGVGGQRAMQWRLVDEVVPRAAWAETVKSRASQCAAGSSRPVAGSPRLGEGAGCLLGPLAKQRSREGIVYRYLEAKFDREAGVVHLTMRGPSTDAPSEIGAVHAAGADFWTLALSRELDDLILDLRTNEAELGTWVLRSEGDPERVLAHDRLLLDHQDDWLAKEILLYLKRTLKRLDVTSRSLIALVEPGSCFAGSLLEVVLASDRSFQVDSLQVDSLQVDSLQVDSLQVDDTREDSTEGAGPAVLSVGPANFGPLVMSNGLTRLESRFFGDQAALDAVRKRQGQPLVASEALALGLVSFAPDDIDWDDEIRITIEERTSFSPDALSGLEANLRFVGPETIETKIFGRLSAWQNWIFSRPNAGGSDGALRSYGTGRRAQFDRRRV